MRRVHFPPNRVLRRVAVALAAMAIALGILSPASSASAYDYFVPCGDINALNFGIINTNAQQGDVVHMILAINCTYTITTAYDPTLGNGLPRFTGAGGATLVIDGNGSTIERADGSAPFRILSIASGATVEINDLTFLRGQAREGLSGDNGGAIQNLGVLTVNDSAFYLNNAGSGYPGADYTIPAANNGGNGGSGGHGGAIYNNGVLTVTGSDFFLNYAGNAGSGGDGRDNGGNGGNGGSGGAIYSSNNSALTITDSVIRNNYPGGGGAPGGAGYGIGPYANWGTQGNGAGLNSFTVPTTISGSLFYQNEAGAAYGGAIYYSGFGSGMTVRNSTFTGNVAQAGGAIYTLQGTIDLGNLTFTSNRSEASSVGERVDFGGDVLYTPTTFGAKVDMRNLILMGNSTAADCAGGPVGSTFYNFGGLLAATGDTSCGANVFASNAGLDTLSSNGGFTQSFALQPGSAAIDAGVSAGCPATDQRGLPRPQRGGCDIGAFELGALPVLSIDDPQGAPVGIARSFHVSTSYARPLVYSWSVSGVAATITGGTTASPTITFAAQGTAFVSVTAHDVLAGSSYEVGVATRSVAIAPAANTGPSLTIATTPRTVDEGSIATFPFTANDAQGNTVSFATGYPSCGTGGVLSGTPTVSASGGTFACRFPSGPASPSVTVQLADSFGARSALATIPISVVDVAPIVTITGDTTPDEDSTGTYSYTVVEPDSTDAAIGTVETLCGSTDFPPGSIIRFHKVDGSDTQTGSGGSISGTFDCYFQDGPEVGIARVSVPTATAELVLTVQNLAPTASISGSSTVLEAGDHPAYDYAFTVGDPSDGDDAMIDWLNASCGALGRIVWTFYQGLTCDFPGGPGTSIVTFTVEDGDGGSTTATFPVTVSGIPPVMLGVLPAGGTTTEGSTVTFDVGATYERDPALIDFTVPTGCTLSPRSDWFTIPGGVVASFTCTFRDGPASIDRTITASNPYGSAGYLITETVLDVAPTIAASVTPTLLLAGATATLTLGAVTDPGNDTVTTWTVAWGDGATSTGAGSPPASLGHVYATEGDFDIVIGLVDEDGTHGDVGPPLSVSVETVPTFTVVPSDSLVEATSAAGALVPYTVTATDVRDGAITPLCTRAPASPGPEFPIGVTDVECVATDSSGYSSSDSFTVTVEDTTAPGLSGLPNDQSLEALSATGASFSFTVTATDLVDGSVAVTCLRSPASLGADFPIGSTLVTCEAEDTRANLVSEEFTVTVVDTTAPVFPALLKRVAQAVDERGRMMAFAIEALDVVDGSIPADCAPASGARFPVGTTTVTCTVVDGHGNSASASFSVVIGPPPAPVDSEAAGPTSTPQPDPDPSDPATPDPVPTADAADGRDDAPQPDLTAALLAGGALALLLFVIGLGWAISLRRP